MYYWHSIAIKAGYKNEIHMARDIIKDFSSYAEIGKHLGQFAGVFKISDHCVKNFFKKYSNKINTIGGYRRVING